MGFFNRIARRLAGLSAEQETASEAIRETALRHLSLVAIRDQMAKTPDRSEAELELSAHGAITPKLKREQSLTSPELATLAAADYEYFGVNR